MDPAVLASLAALITALLAGVGGILATRTRVKIDDITIVQRKLAEARTKLDDEIEARSADRVAYEKQADDDRAAMERRHAAAVESYERDIARLEIRLDERDKRITKLDKAVMAARGYVARLIESVHASGGEVPPRPREMDE